MNLYRVKEILQTENTLAPSEWKGAVLFLCNQDHVFLIKRSEKMPTHGGQIAFVGGHKQILENDPWTVAVREFEEETQHSAQSIEFLGYLPAVMTARLQPIIPVVAELKISTEQFMREVKSNGEWDHILAYPWSELSKENKWEFAWRNGYTRGPILFHPIHAGSYLPVNNNRRDHLLWGATASMVWDFLRLYFKA